MANFSTHISVSTAVGAGFAWWLQAQYGLPWTSAAVAGGLCSIAGMLPDLDSDSSIPARESICFAAAVVPMFLMNRLQRYGMSLEQMVLVGAPLYVLIRFGVGTLLKEFTVHRGMFHSIPAMLIAGFLTFLISDSGQFDVRVIKGIAVSLGFMTHLILDEIWSVEVSITGSRLKKSSGTALKFFGRQASANAMCWGLLVLVAYASFQDSGAAGNLPGQPPQLAAPARPPLRGQRDPATYNHAPYSNAQRENLPRSGTPSRDAVPTPYEDPFQPLPEWPPQPNAPLPAISERGIITPWNPRDQARRDGTSAPQPLPR